MRIPSYNKMVLQFTFLCIPLLSLSQEPPFHQRIEPVVTSHSTDYPDIVLRPGDILHLEAGGCVQTGGGGLTWKRFVNPSGPNSDRLYHGLVNIPGVTNGLERIGNFIGRDITIQSSGHLQLGYEDDGYSDNGYWGKDNGTENQCAGEGNAYVDITITHPKPVQNNVPASQSSGAPQQSTPSDTKPSGSAADPTGSPSSFVPDKPKAFLDTWTGRIVAITGFIGAVIGLIKLFKRD